MYNTIYNVYTPLRLIFIFGTAEYVRLPKLCGREAVGGGADGATVRVRARAGAHVCARGRCRQLAVLKGAMAAPSWCGQRRCLKLLG